MLSFSSDVQIDGWIEGMKSGSGLHA